MHHIVSKKEGGTNVESNLLMIHPTCHYQLHSNTAGSTKNKVGLKIVTTINHTSFHYRLQTIDYRYFELIFHHLLKIISEKINKSNFFKFEILRIDLTLIKVSSKLAIIGFKQTSNDPKKKDKANNVL